MKLLNFMIPITMMALVLVDCKGDHTNNEDDGNTGPPTVVVVERPDMAIELGEAIALYQNYGANRVGLIESFEEELGDVDNYQATRSLTFNFKELRQYMDYVEQEAKTAGTDILGLRVYLGQYDTKNSPHPNAETVFFNPTMKKGDNEVAFAIQNQNGNPTAVPVGVLQDYYLKTGKIKTPGKANLVFIQDDITSLAGNHGGRRPPPPHEDDDYNDEGNN
ncbi:hypothetical protein GCM10011344_43600 [Dokdonia pacifica]|uniref:Uncharacterized protein n=1 Tax=Dokdonia pacifica TaxID=1627892 RepID=A0A239ADX0_9FLAO|nr:hypothetical protein [Dokdonia pacifica]GGG38045.1 hypothetical protein GCM10011344_43600 [Dokdonia pacifica]SNR93769.1 hypothetical protein SAMN06265376_104360 [Dokdonia pacifica]